MTSGVAPCPTCGKPAMLPEYPHQHATPLASSWNPMPPRPAALADLLAALRTEYLAEIPGRLHSRQVPSHTEPIPVDLSDPYGAQMEVTDSGELGGPAFSPIFHRRIGASRFMEGERVESDRDLAPFPYARQLEGVRRWCAGKHRTWYEHQERPLCWVLLRHVVIGGYAIGRAAQLEGVSEEKARELVGKAAGKWFAWVSSDLNGIDLRGKRRSAA